MQSWPLNSIVADLPTAVSMPISASSCPAPRGSRENGPPPRASQGCDVKSVDGQEPRLWIIGRVSTARQRLAKLSHAGQIVDWPEQMDVRQHSSNPPRFGGKLAKAQQRVDPDHAPARLGEPLHRGLELIEVVPLQPVSNEERNRALTKHAPRPIPIEAGHRLADSGAAGPIHRQSRTPRQRIVG